MDIHWSVRHVQRNITRSTPFVWAVTYSFHFCIDSNLLNTNLLNIKTFKHNQTPTIFTLTAHTSGVEGDNNVRRKKESIRTFVSENGTQNRAEKKNTGKMAEVHACSADVLNDSLFGEMKNTAEAVFLTNILRW